MRDTKGGGELVRLQDRQRDQGDRAAVAAREAMLNRRLIDRLHRELRRTVEAAGADDGTPQAAMRIAAAAIEFAAVWLVRARGTAPAALEAARPLVAGAIEDAERSK